MYFWYCQVSVLLKSKFFTVLENDGVHTLSHNGICENGKWDDNVFFFFNFYFSYSLSYTVHSQSDSQMTHIRIIGEVLNMYFKFHIQKFLGGGLHS